MTPSASVNFSLRSMHFLNRFEHSSIILFLNKRDLFEEKIKTSDLRHEGSESMPARFLDYTGGCNAKAAQKYIVERFLELRRRERPIFSHVTCATDTDNVRVVFGACRETILQENMRNSGFMS
jgi:guanine nucleotide-binding protein G(i) subunit alpha